MAAPGSPDNLNQLTIEILYEALSRGDPETVSLALAPDLEYWFHGPPRCQHMMRVLTGQATHKDFRFRPRRMADLGGGWVVAEGWEGEGEKDDYWVHVWAVEGGVITHFREYFNTSITVRNLGSPEAAAEIRAARRRQDGPPVWRSKPGGRRGQSLPGLVVVI